MEDMEETSEKINEQDTDYQVIENQRDSNTMDVINDPVVKREEVPCSNLFPSASYLHIAAFPTSKRQDDLGTRLAI